MVSIIFQSVFIDIEKINMFLLRTQLYIYVFNFSDHHPDCSSPNYYHRVYWGKMGRLGVKLVVLINGKQLTCN